MSYITCPRSGALAHAFMDFYEYDVQMSSIDVLTAHYTSHTPNIATYNRNGMTGFVSASVSEWELTDALTLPCILLSGFPSQDWMA